MDPPPNRWEIHGTPGDAAAWPDDSLAPGPGDALLGGVRVLDLSRVLAGPFATMILGDLGADVIKVERPAGGDDTRAWGPPFLTGPDGERGDAAYFLAVNRNHRSLTLDLADPEGAAVVSGLAAAADVVVENFLPRHLTSLGLEAVREATPGTVWVSVRGAGGDGPAGALPGYDAMAQARAGLMGITGHPETGPVKVGVAITDVVTGLYAAVAALAGLLRRGGEGHRAPRLEVGLLEAAVSTLVNQAANHLVGGIVPGAAGNEHPNIAPYGPVRCADRDLVVGAGNDRQFAALCRAVGLTRLCDDGRFASNAGRVEHRDALAAELAAVFTERTADAWRTVLEDAGVPCAPVNAVDEVFADPHVRAVDLVSTVEHPLGTLPLVGSPLRVDSRRLQVRRPPPTLGQHTGEILRTLGFDDTRIAAMRARGAC